MHKQIEDLLEQRLIAKKNNPQAAVKAIEDQIRDLNMVFGNVFTTDVKMAEDKPPFGMGLDAETAKRVHTVEVWASTFKMLGPDFCFMVGIDKNGDKVEIVEVAGY